MKSDIKIVLAGPYGSALFNYVTTGEATMTPGPSITEGIGNSRVTDNFDGTEIDWAVQIPDHNMVTMVYRMLKKDGWFFGSSTGINLCGAVQVARELGPVTRSSRCSAMTAANTNRAYSIPNCWRNESSTPASTKQRSDRVGTMATINRDGVSVYYERHPSQRDDARTIRLSHGYSATAGVWRGQIDALTRTLGLIVWDVRGHGQSDPPEDLDQYTEALTIGDMAAILDACEVERVISRGLSLGGYLSLAFHRDFPERTEALLLCDTGPGCRNDKAREAWDRMARSRADALDRDGLSALGAGAEVRASQHRSAAGLANAARGILVQFDDRVVASLPEIEIPTLVLVGANEEAFLTPSEYMANKILNAERVTLGDAGHAANTDQPEGFNQAVIGFLGGL